jgi:hypothetical protein
VNFIVFESSYKDIENLPITASLPNYVHTNIENKGGNEPVTFTWILRISTRSMDAIERHKRLMSGPVFLLNDQVGVAIRSEPGTNGKYFAKFPGHHEYEIRHSAKLVTDATLKWTEVTEQQYMDL